jgi:hypothetical protein
MLNPIETAKSVVNLAQEVGKMDLYRQAVELMSQVMEQQQQIKDLTDQVNDLQGKLDIKGKVTFRDNAVWMEGESEPYCAACWESNGKLIHFQRITRDLLECPKCRWNKPRPGDQEPGTFHSVPMGPRR